MKQLHEIKSAQRLLLCILRLIAPLLKEIDRLGDLGEYAAFDYADRWRQHRAHMVTIDARALAFTVAWAISWLEEQLEE